MMRPTFPRNQVVHKLILHSNNQKILGANADKGIGKFTAAYTNDNVQLLVPAGNSAGSYSATLTWTLGNAPS